MKGPKGLQIEVGARRAPRLLEFNIIIEVVDAGNWESEANERIDQLRKRDVTIEVMMMIMRMMMAMMMIMMMMIIMSSS